GETAGGDKRRVAAVTGRDDHHHAATHQTIHFDTQRALAAGKPPWIEIVTEAHVHAMNQQAFAVLIPALDLVDGHEHPAHFALPGSLLIRAGAEDIGNHL